MKDPTGGYVPKDPAYGLNTSGESTININLLDEIEKGCSRIMIVGCDPGRDAITKELLLADALPAWRHMLYPIVREEHKLAFLEPKLEIRSSSREYGKSLFWDWFMGVERCLMDHKRGFSRSDLWARYPQFTKAQIRKLVWGVKRERTHAEARRTRRRPKPFVFIDGEAISGT